MESQTFLNLKDIQQYVDIELKHRKLLKLSFLKDDILNSDASSKYYTGILRALYNSIETKRTSLSAQ